MESTRRLRPKLGSLLKAVSVAACTVVLAGVAFEALATYHYRSRGVPGKLVDVGGYRIHIYCEGTGSPTAVFDGGLGDPSDAYRDLRPKVAITRTCVFDRPGLGWSDDGPLPRSSGQIAKELHEALTKSGEKPPYILVGHSMSGYDVRIFAHEHPEEVAGMLLLDVSHPDQNQRDSEFARHDRDEFMKRQVWWVRLAPFGITRLLGHCDWRPQTADTATP